MKLAPTFEIGGRSVGDACEPYVIAEAGSNFNQSIETAFDLINAAAEAGADAVKFQLFRATQLYPDGGELFDIFKSIELNVEWLPKLNARAEQAGVQFLASAFDIESFRALADIDVPAFKIASSEATNLELVSMAAEMGEPLIISTGMCDSVDVERVVDVCIAKGNHQVALLQCGAQYPLPHDLANLRVIKWLRDTFDCPVGFSDHTLETVSGIAAVGVGASIFEKHFTLDKTADGPDHSYAMEPAELKNYVSSIRMAWQALGNGVKEMLPEERKHGRRDGLYALREIEAGTKISKSDIEARRPALGIRARDLASVTGLRTTRHIGIGEPLYWDALTPSGDD